MVEEEGLHVGFLVFWEVGDYEHVLVGLAELVGDRVVVAGWGFGLNGLRLRFWLLFLVVFGVILVDLLNKYLLLLLILFWFDKLQRHTTFRHLQKLVLIFPSLLLNLLRFLLLNPLLLLILLHFLLLFLQTPLINGQIHPQKSLLLIKFRLRLISQNFEIYLKLGEFQIDEVFIAGIQHQFVIAHIEGFYLAEVGHSR